MERCKDIERQHEIEAKFKLLTDTIDDLKMIIFDQEQEIEKLAEENYGLEKELNMLETAKGRKNGTAVCKRFWGMQRLYEMPKAKSGI